MKENKTWISEFHDAFGPNGIKALAWWIGSHFGDEMRQTYGFWPSLTVFGGPGSGKTTLLRTLWSITSEEPFQCHSTTRAAFGRNLARQNHPVCMIADDSADHIAIRKIKHCYDANEVDPKNIPGGVCMELCDPWNMPKSVFKRTILAKPNGNSQDPKLLSGLLGESIRSRMDEHRKILLDIVHDRYFEMIYRVREVSSIHVRNAALVNSWIWALPKIFPMSNDDYCILIMAEDCAEG